MTLSNLFGVVLAAVGRQPRDQVPAPDGAAALDERGRSASVFGGAARARDRQGIPEPRTMFVARSPRTAAG